MSALDDLEYKIRGAAGEAQGALVLLHGRGTDEFDLLPLLDVLDPDRKLVGVVPRGPLSLPPGGSHWYIVREVGFPDPDTFRSTFTKLDRWLNDLLLEVGVPLERTVIGGFSQGSVMSYALALAESRPAPAGVVALSGFIPSVPGFELDLEERKSLRVAIGHGTHDPVIPVEFGRAARETLSEAGFDVLYRETPIAHSVDPRFLAELAPWVLDTVTDEQRLSR